MAESSKLNVNLNLKQTKLQDKLTQIMVSCTVNGTRIRVYSKLRVEPRYWDRGRQRCDTLSVTNIRTKRRLHNINIELSALVDEVCCADKKLSSLGRYLSCVELRQCVLSLYNKRKSQNNPLLYMRQTLEQYDSGINRRGQKGESSSKVTYLTAISRLERFRRSRHFPLDSFDDFGKRFFESFSEYLYTYTYIRKGVTMNYTKNTVVNTIKVVKNLLHRAYDNDVSDNTYYNRIHTPLSVYASDKIYLTEDEIGKVAAVSVFSTQEKHVRDIFVIACYTALRISDIMLLNDATITDCYISLYQVKTKEEVNIPILKEVAPLIRHYRDVGFPYIQQAKANHIIKDLTRRAGIDDTISFKEYRGGKVIISSAPKCTLVSFHTARRSCLTNLFKRGYSANYLMTLSGHHSILAFQRYLRASSCEMAEKFLAQLQKDKAV